MSLPTPTPARTALPVLTNAAPSVSPPVRYLVLWPTAACDLDCVYCYRRDRSGGRMHPRVVVKAVRRVLEDAERTGKPFHIQLAGGEPTLVPEVIDQVVAMVTTAGYPGSTVAIQTNATRIDSALAAKIKDWGIGVGVSIDGPPSIQEETRGNAKATFAGLINLAAFEVPVRVTTVVSAVNAARLDEVVLTVGSFANITGIALDLLVPLGSAAGRPDLMPSPGDLKQGLFGMYTALQMINQQRHQPLRWRELETVRAALKRPANPGNPAPPVPAPRVSQPQGSQPHRGKTQLPVVKRTYCFAATGQSMAVNPAGEVFVCSQGVGDPARQAGTLDAIDYEALAQFNTQPALNGPCTQCALNARCPGDCPSRIAATTGTHDHPLMCVLYDTIATLDTQL